VLGKNLHRRQLNESQRAIVAAEIATFRRGEKKADFENGEKKPQKHRENNGSAKRAHGPISENEEKKTIEEAAETVGVGPRTVKRAKKVIANAPAEVVETIKAGEATVRDAESVAQESKEVQAKAAGKVKTKAAKTLKEAVAQVKEEEPPQSEEPTTDWPVDELGIPIQGHALKAFEAVPLFQELEALLKKARKLYGQLADLPGGIFLTRPGVSINSSERWKHKGLEDCLSAVQDSRPAYTVCPWTVNKLVNPEAQFDHEADCYLCKGLNWSRPVRKSEPAHSLLEKLKEVHGV
jgi:methylphosphotriester-DNA--protein-cysteine methyltransferase